jgi:hypothetical protein
VLWNEHFLVIVSFVMVNTGWYAVARRMLLLGDLLLLGGLLLGDLLLLEVCLLRLLLGALLLML